MQMSEYFFMFLHTLGIQVKAATKDFSQSCNRLPRKRSASWCSTPKKTKLDLSGMDCEDDETKDPSYLPNVADDSFTEWFVLSCAEFPTSPLVRDL